MSDRLLTYYYPDGRSRQIWFGKDPSASNGDHSVPFDAVTGERLRIDHIGRLLDRTGRELRPVAGWEIPKPHRP